MSSMFDFDQNVLFCLSYLVGFAVTKMSLEKEDSKDGDTDIFVTN